MLLRRLSYLNKSGMKPMRFVSNIVNCQRFRNISFIVLVTVILLFQRDVTPYSDLRLFVAPHSFSIERWVATNSISKLISSIKMSTETPFQEFSNKNSLINEFFGINQEIKNRKNSLNQLSISDYSEFTEGNLKSLSEIEQTLIIEINQLIQARNSFKNDAELVIEESIRSVLEDEGLVWPRNSRGFVFPPVSLRFEEAPYIIVSSPRDKIAMLESVILRPNLSSEEIREIERFTLLRDDLSIWIGKIGGLATYPAIIPYVSNSELGFKTAAHEWLHHYWFFRPLGLGYFRTLEMTTLNETAANIAGDELGIQAMKKLGLNLEIETSPLLPQVSHQFDFKNEMHSTRVTAEMLLEEGRVVEAEQYMEERRLFFGMNGYTIRKLNQAYFAFHGTYGDSPASVSPVASQLRLLRNHNSDLGSFIRLVGGFGSYKEFLQYLEKFD